MEKGRLYGTPRTPKDGEVTPRGDNKSTSTAKGLVPVDTKSLFTPPPPRPSTSIPFVDTSFSFTSSPNPGSVFEDHLRDEAPPRLAEEKAKYDAKQEFSEATKRAQNAVFNPLAEIEKLKGDFEKKIEDFIDPPPPPQPLGHKDYGAIRTDELDIERRAEEAIETQGGETPGNAKIKTENLIKTPVAEDHEERTETSEPVTPPTSRDPKIYNKYGSATGN